VFKPVILMNASAVLLAHNHPSGDPTPSQEDHALTGRLKDAGVLLGIAVLDHLVLGDGRYHSFADHGTL
jgi:DNA repair protein RadC